MAEKPPSGLDVANTATGLLDNDEESTPAIDILCRPADHEGHVDLLMEGLRKQGFTVNLLHDLPSDREIQAPALVAILGLALEVEISEVALRDFGQLYRDVIPVTLRAAGAARHFPELSHTVLTSDNVEAETSAIAAIARVGGERIVAWNRLIDRARTWADNSSPELLMNESDTDFARLMLGDPPAFADRSIISSARQYLDASATTIRQRRRRVLAVLAGGAILLVIVTVVALIQAVEANHSRRLADDARLAAEADRLADTAIRLIGTDPDLPSILLNKAVESSVTSRVHGAVVAVEKSTWPHRSLALGSPRMLSAAADADRVAVLTISPFLITVFDTGTGSKIGEIHMSGPADTNRSLSLSPDGSTVAVKVPGAPISLHPVSGGPASSIAGSESIEGILGWLDTDHIAVATSRGLESQPRVGGTPALVTSVRSGEDVRDYARTSDATSTVVLTGDAIYLERRGVTPIRVAVEGGMDADIADSGDVVAVAAYPRSQVITFEPGQHPVRVYPPVNATQVVGTGDDTFAFGARDGELLQVGNANEERLRSIRGHSGRLLAARDATGRLVTVGIDGFLRVWTTQRGATRPATYLPFGLSDMQQAVFRPGRETTLRESSRNQISVSTGSNRASVIAQPNYMWTVDVSTGHAIRDRPTYFGGLAADMALSPNGTAVVHVGKSIATAEIGIDGSLESPRRFGGDALPMTIAGNGLGLVAVSDDANAVVPADPTHLDCRTMLSGKITRIDRVYSEGRNVAALAASVVNGVPRCIVLTEDGYLRDETGTESRISASGWIGRSSRDPIRITSATFVDGLTRIVAITETGDIYSISSGRTSKVGNIGDSMNPFAVRLSRTREQLIVLGKDGAAMFSMATRTVTHRFPAEGRSFISDVAFPNLDHGEMLIAITSLGAIQPLKLSDYQCVTPVCDVAVPRELTHAEEADYIANFNSGA